jgi:hypothetical protein
VVKNPVAAKEYGDIAADMLKQLKYRNYSFSLKRAVWLIFVIFMNTAPSVAIQILLCSED